MTSRRPIIAVLIAVAAIASGCGKDEPASPATSRPAAAVEDFSMTSTLTTSTGESTLDVVRDGENLSLTIGGVVGEDADLGDETLEVRIIDGTAYLNRGDVSGTGRPWVKTGSAADSGVPFDPNSLQFSDSDLDGLTSDTTTIDGDDYDVYSSDQIDVVRRTFSILGDAARLDSGSVELVIDPSTRILRSATGSAVDTDGNRYELTIEISELGEDLTVAAPPADQIDLTVRDSATES